MPELMKFVFNAKSIEGTLVESYINIAVAEGAQKTYKPRVGKANANLDKYSQEMFDFISKEAGEMCKDLGFYHLFNQKDSGFHEVDGLVPWIVDFNKKQMEKMLSTPRINIEKLPFVIVNQRDNSHIREREFNPIEFPEGRGFQKISRYMMPRATKIGKTLIQMSIQTGERLVVGG